MDKNYEKLVRKIEKLVQIWSSEPFPEPDCDGFVDMYDKIRTETLHFCASTLLDIVLKP